MEINLNIEPGQINAMVAEAVLKSAIGDQVKEAVKRVVIDLSRSYDNPIDDVIKEHVSEMVVKILLSEYQDTIKAAIHAALVEKLSGDFVAKIVESGLRSY